MKKLILLLKSILGLVVFISFNSASAEERLIVIEMGESGQTVSFQMSAEEIADKNAEFARPTAIQQMKATYPQLDQKL